MDSVQTLPASSKFVRKADDSARRTVNLPPPSCYLPTTRYPTSSRPSPNSPSDLRERSEISLRFVSFFFFFFSFLYPCERKRRAIYKDTTARRVCARKREESLLALLLSLPFPPSPLSFSLLLFFRFFQFFIPHASE